MENRPPRQDEPARHGASREQRRNRVIK
jgi:hypothetical protein